MCKDFSHILQIGVVVPDAEQTARHLKAALGWKPSKSWETSRVPGRTYHGEEEDFACRMIFYEFARIEIEIIQPLQGRSCWQDFLNTHGRGVHHLLFDIEESARTEAELARHSIYVEQRGRALPYGENVYWAYVTSAAQLGFIMELTNRREYPQPAAGRPALVQGDFTEISHIGIVVRDAGKTAARWQKVLGWKPAGRLSYGIRSKEEPGWHYSLPNINIEMIQPAGGHMRDFLVEHGEGIHHLQFSIRDAGLLDALARQGIRIIEEGEAVIDGRPARWFCLDTIQRFGFCMEVVIK